MSGRPDNLGALPFTDYADPDPDGQLRIGDDDTLPCDACGADLSEPCRPWCVGDALHRESTLTDAERTAEWVEASSHPSYWRQP